MGNFSHKAPRTKKENDAITLHDFHILRSVGRGAFGKVCIIQKKDTKQLYGLKYMSKKTIVESTASRNVLKELEILKMLHHPFLVNLIYSFQDDEDMYIVLDLMLGGDLRYHLNQGHLFTEDELKLYIMEIALVLDYLKTKRIIHRDIKPDNLLLDSKGHIHLTDFNIATWVPEGKVAVSLSGTRPYMAPEVFATNLGKHTGYSFEVDWWGLGVTLCEIIQGSRPYNIRHDMTTEAIFKLFPNKSYVKSHLGPLSSSMSALVKDLLEINAKKRISSINQLVNYSVMKTFNLVSLEKKLIDAKFTPSNDRLNCDPTHELEEMMIEANPLHKKKRRKRQKAVPVIDVKDPVQLSLQDLSEKFTSFRRGSEIVSNGVMSEETIAILSGRKCCSNQNSPRSHSTVTTPRVKSVQPSPVHERNSTISLPEDEINANGQVLDNHLKPQINGVHANGHGVKH